MTPHRCSASPPPNACCGGGCWCGNGSSGPRCCCFAISTELSAALSRSREQSQRGNVGVSLAHLRGTAGALLSDWRRGPLIAWFQHIGFACGDAKPKPDSVTPATAALAASLLDTFLVTRGAWPARDSQCELLGVAVVMLAVKYNETHAAATRQRRQLLAVAGSKFNSVDVGKAEHHVWQTLGWRLGHVTAHDLMVLLARQLTATATATATTTAAPATTATTGCASPTSGAGARGSCRGDCGTNGAPASAASGSRLVTYGAASSSQQTATACAAGLQPPSSSSSPSSPSSSPSSPSSPSSSSSSAPLLPPLVERVAGIARLLLDMQLSTTCTLHFPRPALALAAVLVACHFCGEAPPHAFVAGTAQALTATELAAVDEAGRVLHTGFVTAFPHLFVAASGANTGLAPLSASAAQPLTTSLLTMASLAAAGTKGNSSGGGIRGAAPSVDTGDSRSSLSHPVIRHHRRQGEDATVVVVVVAPEAVPPSPHSVIAGAANLTR
jgi:hypothetical protein